MSSSESYSLNDSDSYSDNDSFYGSNDSENTVPYENWTGPDLVRATLSTVVDRPSNASAPNYGADVYNGVDVLEQFQSLYGDDRNWNNQFYKASELFSDEDVGKVVYLEFYRSYGEGSDSSRVSTACYPLTNLNVVLNHYGCAPFSQQQLARMSNSSV